MHSTALPHPCSAGWKAALTHLCQLLAAQHTREAQRPQVQAHVLSPCQLKQLAQRGVACGLQAGTGEES